MSRPPNPPSLIVSRTGLVAKAVLSGLSIKEAAASLNIQPEVASRLAASSGLRRMFVTPAERELLMQRRTTEVSS